MTEKTLVEKIKEKEPDAIDISVDGFGAWSCSKLKVAEQCPLKFYLQYVLKVKGPVPVYSLVTDVGKVAHRILEFVVRGKSISDSFLLTRKEFGHMPDEVWEENVSNLELSVTEFQERIVAFEKRHNVKRYVQELRIGFNKEFEPAGFFDKDVFFRGIIDLGIQMDAHDLVIIDHKTGAPAILGIRNFKTQLDTYKLLFHYGVEKIAGAQAGIHFVRDGKVLLDNYVDNSIIEGKLVQELLFNLQGAVDRIKELGFFKHVRGGHCKWCDFNDVCKAGELTEIEKDSKKYFPIKQVQA